MNFYEFSQNNSGGSFVVNDKVCHRLFIEAKSAKIANMIAEFELGCYWDGVEKGYDCDCCGDRWYRAGEDDKTEFPLKYNNDLIFDDIESYVQHLVNEFGRTKPDAKIYFNDGMIKELSIEKS